MNYPLDILFDVLNCSMEVIVMPKSFAERFWGRVDQSGAPDACWEWQGYRMPAGYGQFSAEKKRHYAHRVAYELTKGTIPDGMFVCHACDNPPCCNPAHLFLGTPKDNTRDMVAKGRCRGIGLPGVLSPCAKLNDDAVRRIRELYAIGGYSQRKLGMMFGVSRAAIDAVVTGRNWRKVS